MNPVRIPARLLAALVLLGVLLATATAPADAAPPDPLVRGQYAVTSVDQAIFGRTWLQEANAAGGAATGAAAAANVQVRGSLYMPAAKATPSPLIVFVHGNHGSCDALKPDPSDPENPAKYQTITPAPAGLDCLSGGTSYFKRNDRGYAYLASNLASHGYVVVSLDQDQLMMLQDGNMGKGMHQRRLLIAALLDGIYDAAGTTPPGVDADHTSGTSLQGKVDFSKPIGLMGHSRGGDAVSSFIDYNRTRPAPGRRYDIGGVISLAPVDYERRAPYGTNYLTILPYCDGDVSNLQGARFFERSQYIAGDPFPKIQFSLHGTNHNYFNSVWAADNDDQGGVDVACGPTAANASTSIRLTGGTTVGASTTPGSFLGTYTLTNRGSDDPALMGEQEKAGLALMSSFFRRYVGGETAFDPYMTGELSDTASHRQLPDSACPTSASGARMACEERLMTSYFAPPAERLDVIRPEPDNPLGLSAVGTALTGSGFENPYLDGGGVNPKPATTPGGYDWCNPEPDHFAPAQLGLSSLPTAAKGCPLPAAGALGGQSATRENGPINQSYGLQLALAWNRANTGTVAKLGTAIPAASQDVSARKVLSMGAAVNFFDDRNPDRSGDGLWNPAATTQDFIVALTDAAGVEGTVHAADPRYGNALHQTTGSTTPKLHVILNGLRIPLSDFEAQGVDLSHVRKLELRFGELGTPGSGSIQLADVRFQESVTPVATPRTADVLAAAVRREASAAVPAPITAGGSAVVSGCADTVAPVASVASRRVVGGRLALAGTASDVGCGVAGVAAVQVAVTKAAGAGKCRFVLASGRLSKPVGCGTGYALVAKGKKRWSLKLARKLAAGTYKVTVRALDASGNATVRTSRVVL